MRKNYKFSNGGFRERKREVERERVEEEDEFWTKWRVVAVKTLDRGP